jgi:hypothetical protein
MKKREIKLSFVQVVICQLIRNAMVLLMSQEMIGIVSFAGDVSLMENSYLVVFVLVMGVLSELEIMI